ncbi:MAG: hypothetical protein GC160_14550 [Acidobacteria bacterium]|nr:hypothetical protein [Acidobacteriota bacterium]
MALAFHDVRCEVNDILIEADFAVPSGAVIGVTGAEPAELQLLAELAAGSVPPEEGEIERSSVFLAAPTFHSADVEAVEYWTDAALESAAETLILGPCLALTSRFYRDWAWREIHRLARQGRLVIVVSQDHETLARQTDEVLIFDEGSLALRGEPRETLARYVEMVAEAQREEAAEAGLLEDFPRHGDGRAELVSLELLGDEGRSTATLQSGEVAAVEIRVRFEQDVAKPVVGILLRNRIGVSVYGTNTELEGLELGPRSAGDELTVRFEFRADLCPQEYTLTAACHDPDGTAHDWLEEALLFAVTDSRHTEGVANLRAKVSFS